MKTTMKSKILFIALIGVILTTHTQTKIGFDINDAFTVSGNSVAHYGMSRISGNDYHYVGLSGFFGLNFYTNGKERIKVNRDGYVGIGTTSPQGNLHVSSGTSGDAILKLEADSDNNNEYDNPMIQIRQDAGQVGVNMGFSEENFGANVFGIGTRYLSQEKWDVFAINTKTGNVGIGTTDTKGFELGVNGRIAAEEVKVALYGTWPDFVFEKEYNLPTLKKVEKHIKDKGHLKDIPSALEVAENGIFLGAMNAKLLQKIEELTLYTIQQQKDLEAQQNINQSFEARLKALEAQLKTSN